MKTVPSLLAAGATAVLIAAAPTTSPSLDSPPPTLTVPRVTAAPKMTADPDDPAWAGAAVIPALTPSAGEQPATVPVTTVQVCYDEAALYVRFQCHDDKAASPFTQRDDPLYQADVVEIFIDPMGDQRQYFEIQVSPNNVIFDQNITITTEPRSTAEGLLENRIQQRDFWLDAGYDMPGLVTATSRRPAAGGDGWIVDIKIPASPLLRRSGAAKLGGRTLRANFLRYDWSHDAAAKKLTALNWSMVKHGCPHISPARMGTLSLSP